MTPEASPAPNGRGTGQGFRARFWRGFWPRFYRLVRLVEPLLHRWLAAHRLGDTVEVTIVGCRSGLPRTVLLGLLEVGGRQYVGHPNGVAAWVRNLEAAGEARLSVPGRPAVTVRAIPLTAGGERDAAIRATFRQHPFPGNVLYRLSSSNLRAVGRFFRLEPIDGG